MSHDGEVLSPSPWFLQPVQEEGTRCSSSFTDYMGQQMFQQDAVMAQQQLGLISSPAAGHQIPNSMLQISPPGLGVETPSSHVDASDVQQGQNGQQDLSDTSSNGDHAIEDFGYFNEASMAENDSEEANHSTIRSLGELTPPEVSCEESRDFEQPTEQGAQGTGDQFLDVGYGASLQSAIPVDDEDEDDDSSSTSTSTSTATSSSEIGDLIHVSPATSTDHPARSDAADASLDGLDIINNNDKAADLLKALEDKGALAGILERLGYQKPKDAEAKGKTRSTSQNGVSKNKHICSEPGCGKGFSRPCELK